MTKNRFFYLVLVVLLAGVAALSGAAVGGAAVYQLESRIHAVAGTSSAPVAVSVSNTTNTKSQNPVMIVNTTQIETTITDAVQKSVQQLLPFQERCLDK